MPSSPLCDCISISRGGWNLQFLSQSGNSSIFMEHEGSLSCYEDAATCNYLSQVYDDQYLPSYIWAIHFNVVHPFEQSIPSGLPTNTLECILCFLPYMPHTMPSTSPKPTRVIESIMKLTVTLSFLSPNTNLNTLTVFSSLSGTKQVTYSCKTTENYSSLYFNLIEQRDGNIFWTQW